VIALKLALTGFKAWVGFVDDVNTTLTTDQLIVAMTLHQTFKGIADFHAHTYMMALSHPIEIVRCP
jgi:hypothetical protein